MLPLQTYQNKILTDWEKCENSLQHLKLILSPHNTIFKEDFLIPSVFLGEQRVTISWWHIFCCLNLRRVWKTESNMFSSLYSVPYIKKAEFVPLRKLQYPSFKSKETIFKLSKKWSYFLLIPQQNFSIGVNDGRDWASRLLSQSVIPKKLNANTR